MLSIGKTKIVLGRVWILKIQVDESMIGYAVEAAYTANAISLESKTQNALIQLAKKVGPLPPPWW